MATQQLRDAVDELRLVGVMLRTFSSNQKKFSDEMLERKQRARALRRKQKRSRSCANTDEDDAQSEEKVAEKKPRQRHSFFPVFGSDADGSSRPAASSSFFCGDDGVDSDDDDDDDADDDDQESACIPQHVTGAQLSGIATKVENVLQLLKSINPAACATPDPTTEVIQQASTASMSLQPHQQNSDYFGGATSTNSQQQQHDQSVNTTAGGTLGNVLMKEHSTMATAGNSKIMKPAPPAAHAPRHAVPASTAVGVPASSQDNKNNNNNNNNNVTSARSAAATGRKPVVNEQAANDHRRLFPKSTPGWTRRVEPSVISKYASAQGQQQQPATSASSSAAINNSTGGANNKAPPPPLPHAPLIDRPNATKFVNSISQTEVRHAIERQELTQASAASLYVVLRACAVALRAESAAVYIYFGGEMICCGAVGPGAVFPPCSTRFASGGSLAHAVLSSGVALHRTVRQNPKSSAAESVTVDYRGRRKSSTFGGGLPMQQQHHGVGAAAEKVLPVQDTMIFPVFLPHGQGYASLSHQQQEQATNKPSSSSSSLLPFLSNKSRRQSVTTFQVNDEINGEATLADNNNHTHEREHAQQQQQQQQQQQHQHQQSSGRNKLFPCHAVLQLQNKNRGTSAFTEADEAKLALFSDMIGYVMMLGENAGLDYRTTAYDPIALQKTVPFFPAPPLPNMNADECQTDYTFLSSVPFKNKNAVTKMFEDFEPTKLIHRSVVDSSRQGAEAGTGVARRAVLGQAANEVGPAPSLREIDQYVSNLRDTWRRAVNETVTSTSESSARAQQVRDLKTELERSRGEVEQLSQLLQLERFNAGDYVSHYQHLKSELDEFLTKRTQGSDELFSWSAAGGGTMKRGGGGGNDD